MPIEIRYDGHAGAAALQQAYVDSAGQAMAAAQARGGGGGGGGFHGGGGGGGGGSGIDFNHVHYDNSEEQQARALARDENQSRLRIQEHQATWSMQDQRALTQMQDAQNGLLRDPNLIDENGNLNEDGQQLHAMIGLRIDPLEARRTQSQNQLHQAQTDHAIQQTASAAAVQRTNEQIIAGNLQNVTVPLRNRDTGEIVGHAFPNGQGGLHFIPAPNPVQQVQAETAQRQLYGGSTRTEIEDEVREAMAARLRQEGFQNATADNLEDGVNPAEIRRQVDSEVQIRAQAAQRAAVPFPAVDSQRNNRNDVEREYRDYIATRGARRPNESTQEYEARTSRTPPTWLRRDGQAAQAEAAITATGLTNRVELAPEEVEVARDREIQRRMQRDYNIHQQMHGRQRTRGPLFDGMDNGNGAAGPAAPSGPPDQARAFQELMANLGNRPLSGAVPSGNTLPANQQEIEQQAPLNIVRNPTTAEHVSSLHDTMQNLPPERPAQGALGQTANAGAIQTLLGRAATENRGLNESEQQEYQRLIQGNPWLQERLAGSLRPAHQNETGSLGRLVGELATAYNAMPWHTRTPGLGYSHNRVGAMYEIVRRAYDQGRPLTAAERQQYERIRLGASSDQALSRFSLR